MPATYRDATYAEALQYLETLTNLGIKPGLSRMEALVSAIGDPHRCAPVIHITGTNGKTSTARMVSSILQAAGLRTGTYTSPHLQVVNERIEIDLEPLDKQRFASAFADAYVAAAELERLSGEKPSYFEMVTLMAFAAFADAPVSVQVVEVGMGGKWDATNVADADVAVVTNVSVDHVEYLGSTPPLIAAEKAGIIKEGSLLIVGETQPDIVEIFESVATDSGADQVIKNGDDFRLLERKPAVGGQLISVKGIYDTYEDLFLPLFGGFQAHNAAVAIAACEALCESSIDRAIVEAALSQTTSPGRMEVVSRHPLVVLDGAHNPAGMAACIDAVRESFAYDRLHVVFGVFADKDYLPMLAALGGVGASVFTTQTALARSAPAENLASAARKVGIDSVSANPDVVAALDAAKRAASDDDLVLVTGSLYLIGEARTYLVGVPEI